jgi:3-oxocholest-4-en-26-oyl-CoA dehydrogenase alpha subunit
MDFNFTPEEEEFRKELREFFKKEITPEWRKLGYTYWEEDDESWAITEAFNKKLGENGYLGLTLPKEFGGLGKSHFEQVVFEEELVRDGRAPTWIEKNITVDWVTPTILMFGSEEQKKKYPPLALKGEINFCLGYSEPDSGSDLVSMKTTATEDGEHYVINGQKTWTTVGHRSDYCWLAARTDPDAPPHKGISMFIVDMKTPGVTCRPVYNMLQHHSFNEVFFDDVRVPKENLVGVKNKGWYQMMVALTFERGNHGFPAHLKQLLMELVEYCKTTKRNGEYLSKDPVIRKSLAKLAVDIETFKLLNYRITCLQDKDKSVTHQTSEARVFGIGVWREMARVSTFILGPHSLVDRGSKCARLNGTTARWYLNAPSMSVGGGTTEIQTNIIAQVGLGLPIK